MHRNSYNKSESAMKLVKRKEKNHLFSKRISNVLSNKMNNELANPQLIWIYMVLIKI